MFVSALQRFSHAPKIIHCKRLNIVVRWAQRNPKKLFYRRLSDSGTPGDGIETHLRMYGDAAFKKEEDSGHSMRGALYVRCYSNMFKSSVAGHLLDFSGNKQNAVQRIYVTTLY